MTEYMLTWGKQQKQYYTGRLNGRPVFSGDRLNAKVFLSQEAAREELQNISYLQEMWVIEERKPDAKV